MSPFLLLALTASAAAQQPAFGDTSFHLGGYGWAGFDVPIEEGTTPEFGSVGFAPIFLWREGDRMLVQTELEIVYGTDGLDVALEYATLDVDVGGPIVSVGKFLTPVGTFMPRLHPTWINKMILFPLPYRVGTFPMSHVGLSVQHAVRLGSQTRIMGTVFVDNGPQGTGDTPMLVPSVTDDDLDKGVGGRLSVQPVPEVELGVSGYTGAWNPDDPHRLWLGVADAAWTRAAWLDVRAEFLAGSWDAGGYLGGWAQGAWRIRQVQKLAFLEPVLRFGWAKGLDGSVDAPSTDVATALKPMGGEHGASDYELTTEPIYEFCYGLNAYLRNNILVKANFVHHVEDWSPTIHLSLAYGY